MAGLTVYSNLSPKVQAYYDRRFLLRVKPTLVAFDHAQKKPLPTGEGKTVYFSRYKPLQKRTTPLTETDTGGLDPGTRQQLNTEEISATIDDYGDYVKISKIASLTSIDPNVSEKVDIVSQQAAESIDYNTMKVIGQGALRRRADADTNYQIDGVTDGAGSTTTIVDSVNLTQADDYWNGGYITITNPLSLAYGETRQITDFDQASNTATVSPAFTIAPGSGAYYRIVVGTGLVAGDKITTTNIRLALRDLGNNKAMKYEANYWLGFIDPDVIYDLMGDDKWTNAATYKDKVDNLYTGELGRWFGVRFLETHQLYRESAAGAEQDGTGAIHVCPIIGRESYGVVNLEGQEKMIVIRTPDQLGQPLNMSGTVGWQVKNKPLMLNANFAVNLMVGASA